MWISCPRAKIENHTAFVRPPFLCNGSLAAESNSAQFGQVLIPFFLKQLTRSPTRLNIKPELSGSWKARCNKYAVSFAHGRASV